MKKILTFALILTMIVSMFVPMSASAADGELLIAVNWLTDKLETVNQGSSSCQDINEKFDLSKCTADMFFPLRKGTENDATWKSDFFYVEHSGYYITNDTKYTIYCEIASPHLTRYSGIPMLHENSAYQSYIMLMGHFSDYGDTVTDGDVRWTEFAYAYDYANRDSRVGEGYDNDETVMACHPALSVEDLGSQGFTDICGDGDDMTPVTEFKFSTIKIEFDGLSVTTWYLDADKNWQRADSFGSEVTYDAEFGSEIILGTYTRNQMRHNVMRNLKLLQGTGLTYDQIWTAKQTTDPKPAKPADPTTAPVTTKAPVVTTAAPDTDAPTEAVATTAAPEADTTAASESKGCASAVAFVPVIALAAAGAFISRRKRK